MLTVWVDFVYLYWVYWEPGTLLQETFLARVSPTVAKSGQGPAADGGLCANGLAQYSNGPAHYSNGPAHFETLGAPKSNK